MHHQSIKTKKCQRTIFYPSSCKNSVRTCIFNDADALQNQHTMTLRRFISFTSAKVVLDQRPYYEKNAHTSALLADFRTNMVKYGWVDRSALEYKCQTARMTPPGSNPWISPTKGGGYVTWPSRFVKDKNIMKINIVNIVTPFIFTSKGSLQLMSWWDNNIGRS